MVKILVIGDPHGNIEKLKKIDYLGIDLILMPGDIGKADLIRKMTYGNIDRKKRGLPEIYYSDEEKRNAFLQINNSTIEVVKFLSEKTIVYLIFGNVELSNVKTEEFAKRKGKKIPILEDDLNLIKNVKVINNKVVEFRGMRIGGLKYFLESNWVERFKKNEDDYDERMRRAIVETEEARKALESFGKLDILICHQPPNGVLDVVRNSNAPLHWQGMHAGSDVVLEHIKKLSPRYVFCGHIHEGKGEEIIGNSKIYNLGLCGSKVFEIN